METLALDLIKAVQDTQGIDRPEEGRKIEIEYIPQIDEYVMVWKGQLSWKPF